MMRRVATFAWLLLPLGAVAQTGAGATPACAPSPRLATAHYPGARAIPPSNDLTRFNGKAVAAAGQQLHVQLRLRDARCVPIQGAVIELWQKDPHNNWRLAGEEDRVNPNPVFSGAGRAYTDNNGAAAFLTLFPAAAKGEAPRLYVRVKAPVMAVFDTVLYFGNDMRNASDSAYKRLSPTARQQVELRMEPLGGGAEGGFRGSAEIILPGAARYRSY